MPAPFLTKKNFNQILCAGRGLSLPSEDRQSRWHAGHHLRGSAKLLLREGAGRCLHQVEEEISVAVNKGCIVEAAAVIRDGAFDETIMTAYHTLNMEGADLAQVGAIPG